MPWVWHGCITCMSLGQLNSSANWWGMTTFASSWLEGSIRTKNLPGWISGDSIESLAGVSMLIDFISTQDRSSEWWCKRRTMFYWCTDTSKRLWTCCVHWDNITVLAHVMGSAVRGVKSETYLWGREGCNSCATCTSHSMPQSVSNTVLCISITEQRASLNHEISKGLCPSMHKPSSTFHRASMELRRRPRPLIWLPWCSTRVRKWRQNHEKSSNKFERCFGEDLDVTINSFVSYCPSRICTASHTLSTCRHSKENRTGWSAACIAKEGTVD